jgi:hypothetical protein
MSGLTNCATGGDSPVEACFLALASVETAASTSTLSLGADATAIMQPNIDPNAEADAVAAEVVDASAADSNSTANVNANPDSWRLELAARLERYRTRRKPRAPRYPSLRLPFDAPEAWSRTVPACASGTAALAASLAGKEFVFQSNPPAEVTEPPCDALGEPVSASAQSPKQSSGQSFEESPLRGPGQDPEPRPRQYPDQSSE